MKRLILLSAPALMLCGCWSQSAAVQVRSIAPEVPPETDAVQVSEGPQGDTSLPPRPPADTLPDSAVRPNQTLRLGLAGGAVGLARQALPSTPYSDDALLRLTIPVGASSGPTGLAGLVGLGGPADLAGPAWPA